MGTPWYFKMWLKIVQANRKHRLGRRERDRYGKENERQICHCGALSLSALAAGPKKVWRGTTALARSLSLHPGDDWLWLTEVTLPCKHTTERKQFLLWNASLRRLVWMGIEGFIGLNCYHYFMQWIFSGVLKRRDFSELLRFLLQSRFWVLNVLEIRFWCSFFLKQQISMWIFLNETVGCIFFLRQF